MFNAEFWTAETLDDPATGASRYGFLADITQGGNDKQRIGDQIYLKRIIIKLHLHQSASSPSNIVRLALVQDTEPAAGVPNWSDIWQGGLANTESYMQAIKNYDKGHRFRILRQFSRTLQWGAATINAGTVTGAPQKMSIVINKAINKKIWYDGAATVPYKGCELYLFAWGENNSNTVQAYGSYQVFFTDA